MAIGGKRGVSTKIVLAIRGRVPLINPPRQKRGVSTKIVLAIGLVVLVAIVLLIGVNLMAPLFRGTEEHALIETVLSIDAVYAGPEDVGLVIKLPSAVREHCTAEFRSNEVKFRACELTISGGPDYTAKFTKTRKTISDVDHKHPIRFVFSKEYNETKGENKKLEIKAKERDIWFFF